MDLITQFLNAPTFWVMVAFFVFVGALARPISGAIAAALDKRADKIRADLEEAEKLREEAQNLLASYQRQQRDAVKEAEAIVEHAKEEAERLTQQGRERLKAALERREKQAMDRIAQAEAAADDGGPVVGLFHDALLDGYATAGWGTVPGFAGPRGLVTRDRQLKESGRWLSERITGRPAPAALS